MQSVKIPVTIDPAHAVAKKLDYQGMILKKDLSRLAGRVEEIAEDIQVSLSFYKDMSGLNIIEGNAKTSVVMICQRCLESMTVPLETSFKYTADIRLLKELELEDDIDYVELNSFGEVHLYDIIEDELILSLPIIAKHPEQECPASSLLADFSDDDQEQEGRYNPFLALGGLLEKQK